MRNLIWQFHVDLKSGYHGPFRKKMAMASSALASFYAMKYANEYKLDCYSKWHHNGYHGGPAMERFQLFEESYDIYDYILYLDTDILISPEAPNVFSEYNGSDIVGIHQPHPRDVEVLKNGWLKDTVDPERYIQNYVNGAILLLSRKFRQSIRSAIDVSNINVDKGKHWDTHGLDVKWPVYDQSMLSFHLCQSEFDLTHIDQKYAKGPYFVNYGGQKSNTSIKLFFRKYFEFEEAWLEKSSIPE